jgi:hypothetical protein
MKTKSIIQYTGCLFIALVFFLCFTYGQQPNPIITAFPSLKIPVGSRGLSMGGTGIASANENEQLFYNAAKTAFTQNFHQVSVNYMPWLTGISNDTRFMNVNYLANVTDHSSFGISLGYLSLGNMATRDDNGATIAMYKSSEYNLLASYALQLGSNGSLGVGLRFLGQQPVQLPDQYGYATVSKSIFSADADISYFGYHDIDKNGSKLEWGVVISNIGPKISLQGNDQKTFLPTNLGIGFSYTNSNTNTGDRFTAALDVNKLLVPTPGGKNPNPSILHALFSSFTDAPGGLSEELKEIKISTGIEYAFAEQFFLRGGVSLEDRLKGNRKYLGLGVGYKGSVNDQSWSVDFHYLVPFGTIATVSPFQNAYGFSLKLSIGNFE